jgi:SAM-dependent methyltransferase
MNEALQRESEKLARSWMQHESACLRDYLVAGVEDPRLNLQSVLSRHFLLRSLFGGRFSALREAEYRFAATMNWLRGAVGQKAGAAPSKAVLEALRRGALSAGGIRIPQIVVQTFARLPMQADGVTLPNFLERALSAPEAVGGPANAGEAGLNTFCELWSEALAGERAAGVSVLEPGCGSANDYRFLHRYGIARFLDYTGFDLCPKNIENARALFPNVRFESGNAFEIAAADRAWDLCIVHDLFEHLSMEGLGKAVSEVCRVTRRGLCVGFFQMDEILEHVVRPVDDYHWNLLSMARMRELFASHGFAAQVLHIGTFLREHIGGGYNHNPNAYTFLLHREERAPAPD